MSSAGLSVATFPLVLEAHRRGDTLVMRASSTMGLRHLLRCDGCGNVCAAGVDEAAARLNLEATGGSVRDGSDYCPGCHP